MQINLQFQIQTADKNKIQPPFNTSNMRKENSTEVSKEAFTEKL